MSLSDSPENIRILAASLDNAPLGLVCLDGAGVVRAWSREASRLLGWTPEDVIGRPMPTDLHVLHQIQQDETETRLQTKAGGFRDVRVQTALWRDAQGRDGKL